jgi:hypothetical protein
VGVTHILHTCHVLQILGPVVRLDSVLVVDFQTFRAWTQESFSDEMGNTALKLFSVAIDVYAQIALTVIPLG